MRHLRVVVFLLILCLPGCQAPERSAETPAPPAAATAGDALVNHVWVRSDPGAPLGELRIFLSDGTLVLDSCWEVYVLRTWRRVSADEIVLVEDVEIPARIVALNQDELRLSLSLADGTRQEVSYKQAQVPYICPDLKSRGAS